MADGRYIGRTRRGKKKIPPCSGGFTLVEMVIVVVVVGILVSIAVPALSWAKEEARLSAARGSVKTLNEARDRVVLDGRNTILSPMVPEWWEDSGNAVDFDETTGYSLEDRRAALNWLVENGYILNPNAEKIRLEDLRFYVNRSAEWTTYKEAP